MTRQMVTLDDSHPKSLQQVVTRRRHLQGALLLVFLITAAGVVVLSITSQRGTGEPLFELGPVRAGFAAISLVFAGYVFTRERALSRAEQALIEERVLSAALSNRLHELSKVSEAGAAVSSILSQDQVFDVILQSAKDLLGATEASIMLLDEDAQVLRIAAAAGIDRTIARESAIPVGDGVAGWVAESLQPVILTGDVRDLRFRDFAPKERRVRSAMSVPLSLGGQPMGVLNVSISEAGRDYSENDLRALTVFAEHAAAAISNAQTYERERAAKLSLAEVDRQRRDFLATLTHDLKTPLTSILGYVKLIRRAGDSLSSEQAQLFTDVIERQGKRILVMVEQLVEASRLEEGPPSLSREPIDLVKIIDDQAMAVRGMTGERKLTVHLPTSLDPVFGDRSAIEQIVSNLLENAVKYCPEAGAIDVEVEPDDTEVRVSVTDDGPGIPDEELTQVFNRYHQASTRASAGSVGLGLYIVQSLAQAHGGRAWAENVAGRGARVTFTLPVRAES